MRAPRIESGPDGCWLSDAGSQNGTWLNGTRCERAQLVDGDVIQVGSTQLVFRLGAEADATLDEPGDILETLIRESEPDLAQRFRSVASLLRAMSTNVGSDQFFEQLIDAAVELTSAERGFLIMNSREGMQFRAARNIGQEDRKNPAFEVSWSIAVRVGTSGEGVLLVDAKRDDRFGGKESVEALGGEEQTEEDVIVLGADAVDTAVALDDPHRVPRQVVVDHLPGLLEVHAFGEHVGGEQDVELVLGRGLAGGVAGAGGRRGESGDGRGTTALVDAAAGTALVGLGVGAHDRRGDTAAVVRQR